MQANFVYLNWDTRNRSKYLEFKEDKQSTVWVRTSVGVYKNNYGDFLMERSGVYYWEI